MVVVAILHKRCEEESANATHTAIKLTTFVNYRGNYTHVNVWISQTLGNSMRYSQCFFGCFEIANRIKDQFQWNMISAASMKPCTVLHCIPLSVKFIVIADKTSLHQSLWTWKIEDVTRLYYVICVVLCGYVENKANQKPQSENRTPRLHCLRANAYKHM